MELTKEMAEKLSVPNAVVVDGHLNPITDIHYVMVEGETITLVNTAGIAIIAKSVGWTSYGADKAKAEAAAKK